MAKKKEEVQEEKEVKKNAIGEPYVEE